MLQKSALTVLVVDDHPLLRKGVVDLLELEDSIMCIGEASNGHDALQLALELEPDLILAFSDIQADLAAKLIKAHLPVLIFNQRSITEILEMIQTLGRMVGSAAGRAKTVGREVRRWRA